jgi:hypothetical protein
MRTLTAILGWAVAVYLGLALYLYLFQARHLYFPNLPSRLVAATPADVGLEFETVTLSTADGETVTGWFVPAPHARGTLLYLHGNAGNVGHRLDGIAMFHQLGLDTLIIDYRGYGASSGKPSEAGTYQDALAAWNHLTRHKRLAPERIVLFGESLGGSVAAWLAARYEPAGLITYASFTSVPDIARELYPIFPAWLVRYRYDTAAALARVKRPVLVIHSRDDEIVPFGHGQALFAAAAGPKHLVALHGGHNDAVQVSRERYEREISAFVDALLPR